MVAKVLRCSLFDVLGLDILDYMHWRGAAVEHQERVKREQDVE